MIKVLLFLYYIEYFKRIYLHISYILWAREEKKSEKREGKYITSLKRSEFQLFSKEVRNYSSPVHVFI